MLWDRGYWEPEGDDPHEGLKKGDLKFVLEGERLQGGWVLVRMKRDAKRREAQQLAADQAPRRLRRARATTDALVEETDLGRLGPHDGGDRGRQGQGRRRRS